MTKNKELLAVLIGTLIAMLFLVGVMIFMATQVGAEPIQNKPTLSLTKAEVEIEPILGANDLDPDEKKLKDDIVNGKTQLTIGGAKDEWRVIAPALLEKLKKKKGLTDAQFLKLVMEEDKDFIKTIKALDKRKDR